MHIFNRQSFSQSFQAVITSYPVSSSYDWAIRLYFKDGGLKKVWYIGQIDNPITSIE